MFRGGGTGGGGGGGSAREKYNLYTSMSIFKSESDRRGRAGVRVDSKRKKC